MKIWTLAFAALSFIPFTAHAQTSVDAANRFTGGILLQDTDYHSDGSYAVKGQLVEGGYKAAINPRFAIGGGVGLMFDGDIGRDHTIGSGEGFRLFGDAQYEFHRFNQNKIIGTGTLSFDRFSFSEAGTKVDFKATEFKIGGLFMHDVREFSLYGGLEIVLYSNASTQIHNISEDAHRDDRLNVRLGATFNATKNVALRADLLLIGEQTILFAADFAL
ncbi:MAG: hypothetical protein H7249_18150 [Chitinophagaceae bacterium]|nr:hypothetical protein [Oligoflexus sp.]